jgi:hypothetical protein
MEYSLVLNNDDEITKPSSHLENFNSVAGTTATGEQIWKRFRLRYIVLISISGLFLMLALAIVIYFVYNTRHIIDPIDVAKGLGCGNTTLEARAAGCEFDILSYSWTPSECFDRETAAEFLAWLEDDKRQFGAWPFFSDPNGHERVLDVQILSERVFLKTYSTQEEHLGHCVFWMRHLERVNDGLVPRTARGVGMRHTIHCTNSLLERFETGKTTSKEGAHAILNIGFNSC